MSPTPDSISAGMPDYQRININDPAAIHYWTQALACSELELRVAVAEVGITAGDVGSQLGRAA
ncbi:MAG: DUF3606 domain-containing protein [Pseudomonadota bacterium]